MFVYEFEKNAFLGKAVSAVKGSAKLGKNIGGTVKDWMFTPLGAGFVAMDAAAQNKRIKQQALRPLGSRVGPKRWNKMMEQRKA